MYTQSNTSFGIIVYNHDFEHTVYDCLLNDFPVQEVIQETDTPNLYVLPATIDLVGAEVELAHAHNRHGRMKLIIEQIKDDFDFIFIDCLPRSEERRVGKGWRSRLVRYHCKKRKRR